MNILIFAGGTGSIALQTGLFYMFGAMEGFDVKVLTNALDNGLSTGLVRKVLNGNILGPSDVRKNQTTRFKLENPDHPLNAFLDERFTTEPKKALSHCLDRLSDLRARLQIGRDPTSRPTNLQNTVILERAIEAYFDMPMADKIDYNDFSLANIVYAGLAAQNGNSIRKAASIMSEVLGIKDNVLLNDDTSLFLGAITRSGKHIADEGDIVSWNNPQDPIIDLCFVDAKGNESKPQLNQESKDAIAAADLIILSSGTQWSSLIPTYESIGFKEAILQSSAKILMVMNRVPDKDAPGQSASDIVRTLVPKYFPADRIHLIVDSSGHVNMNSVDESATRLLASVNSFDLRPCPVETVLQGKHHAVSLARAVAKTYFSEYLNSSAVMFDYDDTLVGRGNSHPFASEYNSKALLISNKKKYICSGNSIKAIQLKCQNYSSFGYELSPLTVFADGGINEYTYEHFTATEDEEVRRYQFVRCLDESTKFAADGEQCINSVADRLRAVGIPLSKLEARGEVMLTIKPVDPEYRDAITSLVKMVCSDFEVRIAGRSTIEISKPNLAKDIAVHEVLRSISDDEHLVYVGDEFECGNDRVVADLAKTNPRVKFLKVRTPSDTAFFFMALN